MGVRLRTVVPGPVGADDVPTLADLLLVRHRVVTAVLRKQHLKG